MTYRRLVHAALVLLLVAIAVAILSPDSPPPEAPAWLFLGGR